MLLFCCFLTFELFPVQSVPLCDTLHTEENPAEMFEPPPPLLTHALDVDAGYFLQI